MNKKRDWCAKLEGGITNITLDTFLKLAEINEIDVIIKEKEKR